MKREVAMGVMPDHWIREQAQAGMIKPFEENQIRSGISFGIGSYGYDFRLGRHFQVYQPGDHIAMDPKNFDQLRFEEVDADCCTIPANSYVLARSLETFDIPRDVLVLATGKSTYARCGIVVNVTPLEPEWQGVLTVSISNTTPSPAKLYAGEGVGQLIFLAANEICAVSYADKKGKYQSQSAITGAKGKG